MVDTGAGTKPARPRRAPQIVPPVPPVNGMNGASAAPTFDPTEDVSSFANAMSRFDSLGVDEVRAAFRIGWAVAQLRWLIDQHLDEPPPSAEPPKLLSADDLSADDQVRLRLFQIDVALSVLPFTGEPNTEQMVKALAASKRTRSADLLAALGAFEAEVVLSCARAETLIASTNHMERPAAVPAGLTKAYEVGRLLGGIVMSGTHETDASAFHKLLSLGTSPDHRQAVDRAHSLLAELHSSMPAGAANAVSRHLDDWSDWLRKEKAKRDKEKQKAKQTRAERKDAKRNPVARFDLITARLALGEQGDIWQSVLSGQTVGRGYLTSNNYADAADHLLCHAAAGNQSIARHFLGTTVGKLVLGFLVLALAVFGSVVALTVLDPSNTGGKTGTGLVAVLATAGGAGSLVHATRKRLTNLATDVWGLVQGPMIEAELGEAIAQATRRLPTDLLSR